MSAPPSTASVSSTVLRAFHMQALPSTPIDSVSSVTKALSSSSSPLVNFGFMSLEPSSAAAVFVALFSTFMPWTMTSSAA